MARELGAAGRSRFETLGGLGVSPISVGAAMDPEERINAGRLMIPMTWFDVGKCAGGLERLRGYRKRWNRATRSYGGPLHDQASGPTRSASSRPTGAAGSRCAGRLARGWASPWDGWGETFRLGPEPASLT